jgi:hypothetical protein
MPVKGKRILVTLSWDTYNTIADLAKAMDEPVASVARGILEDSAPSLRALVDRVDRLRTGDLSAIADLNALIFDSLGQALQEGSDILREARKRSKSKPKPKAKRAS